MEVEEERADAQRRLVRRGGKESAGGPCATGSAARREPEG